MGNLIDAADAAYPFAYGLLPNTVRHILGYVGLPGYTPNIWTAADVAAVHAAGRQWHPIVTLPEHSVSAEWGQAAARCQLAACAALGYAKGGPVFLDVEHDTYVADPPGADAAVAAWRVMMAAGGYPTCVPYLPLVANRGWVAGPVTARPDVLPATWQGWQYARSVNGGRYDLSVFDPAVFTAPVPTPTPTPWDGDMLPDERAWLKAVYDFVASIPVAPGQVSRGETVGSVLPAVQHLTNIAIDVDAKVTALEAAETPPAPGP